jgi:hypothetical protein
VQRKNHRDVDVGRPGPLEIRVDVARSGHRHLVTPALVERFLALVPDWSEVSRGLEVVLLADGTRSADGWYEPGFVALNAWYDPVAITVTQLYHAEHREIWARLGVASRPDSEFLRAVPGMILSEHEHCLSTDVHAMIEQQLGFARYDMQRGRRDGEWLAIERRRDDEPPELLELVQLGDEVHMYEPCVHMRFDRVSAAAYQLLHVLLHELGHHVDAMTRPRLGRCVRGESFAEQWAQRTADQMWEPALALIHDALTRA